MNDASKAREWPAQVSIVVPCFNEADHIEGFLRDMLRQENDGWTVEIIVADGLSTDGTREVISALAAENPAVTMIDNPSRFVPHGLNRAIAVAGGEVIIRADVHTRYASDYIKECLQTLIASGADNVGGSARTEPSTAAQRMIALAYNSPYSVGGAKFHDPDYEGWADTVPYGCWWADFFERLGRFDEELIRNQDDELNLRAVRYGNGVWQSRSIRSWYRPRSSLRALFRQYMQYGYWKVLVMLKHRRFASVRQIVPICAVLLGLSLLAAGLVWPAAWVTLGVLAAVYLAGVVAGSVHICAKNRAWRLLPRMPLALMTFHTSYGLGFLLGVIDFLVLRRRGRASMGGVTR